jgi:bifunctional aspartokinase / homoserine dehydrogenase 1
MTQLKAIKQPETEKAPNVKKLFIAGVGAVGSTLLKQVSKNGTEKSLRVLGVCNTKHVLWYDHSQREYSLNDLLRAPEREWDTIIRKLASYPEKSVVFIDATGNPDVAELYPRLLQEKIHVVTPSKLANTQSQDQFNNLHYTAGRYGVEFRYETNVGAGLPIIHAIKNLQFTGDKILELSGVVSGTMTYLFSELDKGNSFSGAVLKARALGYAEPDPRDDLSGEDVARKFLILARICGLNIERSELNVESLIPDELKDVDAATFLEKLHQYDEAWKIRLAESAKKGETLRYTGSLKKGKIKVGIESVPTSSAIGQLNGTNNLIRIKSRRYYDQPLVIQGPGAGKEVTAAGVLADILSIRP